MPRRCAQQLGEAVLAALARNPLYHAAALPLRTLPPRFNRYQGGGAVRLPRRRLGDVGRHRPGQPPASLRSDVSCTLFLCEPDEYDGGELIVNDTYGEHEVKLPAGDLIVYPSSSLHRVSRSPAARAWRRSSGCRAWCATTASGSCCSNWMPRSRR